MLKNDVIIGQKLKHLRSCHIFEINFSDTLHYTHILPYDQIVAERVRVSLHVQVSGLSSVVCMYENCSELK